MNPKTSSSVYKGKDRISELSDDLLLKILSSLPTKHAASTSILSKRWEFLYLWLPKLKYYNRSGAKSEDRRLHRFFDRYMPLNRAPIIESFHLGLSNSQYFRPQDIESWIVFALSRNLSELDISISDSKQPKMLLPTDLFISKSLVTLKLYGHIVLEVFGMVCCLQSLKTLYLYENKSLDGPSLEWFLSICPVLEDLLVEFFDYDNYEDVEYINTGGLDSEELGLVTVSSQSLQSLSLYFPDRLLLGRLDGVVIDTPSLKYLKLVDHTDEEDYSCLIENCMPNLEEAYVHVGFHDIKSLIGGISSVKRLLICLKDIVYDGGFVFNRLENLENLKLCICLGYPSNLLVQLLEDSPNLRVLDIFEIDHYNDRIEGSPNHVVPEPIQSCLQKYLQERRDLVVNIFGKPFSLEDCDDNLV